MAYENMTYEVILNRMIQRVSEQNPNLDTREGSILFNALAPAAIELAVMYTELDNVLNESFVDTASRYYILRACEQIGMDTSVFDASAGVHKGEFNVEVPVGSRWNCELYNYTVTEYIQKNSSTNYYEYRMVSETLGTAPNNQTGDLTAIDSIPEGLSYAKVTECLVEGENESSDDEIRVAYYDYIDSSASDGNVGQYERWCAEYDGIGNAKIFPLWNGANTVKVSILSSSNRAASSDLIDEFQNYLDPNSEGMGNGIAPIGAKVTVTTATEKPINVSATVTLKSGYSDTSLITKAVSDYLASISYEKSVVAYLNIGSVILNVDGVESVNNLTLNDAISDISLNNEEIPVIGTATWTVSN